MKQPNWDRFEWDDEHKKNGNVQHLRDHDIEEREAEECFFHDYLFARDERRFDDVYVLDGRTDRGRYLRLIFQDKGNGLAANLHWMGIEVKAKKEMKKQFAKLSKAEREKTELEYHHMRPEDFEKEIARAKRNTPTPLSSPKRKGKAAEKRRAA